MQPLRVTGSRREAVPVKKGCWIGKKKKKREYSAVGKLNVW